MKLSASPAELDEIFALVNEICPILAGKPPVRQGAVLAELVSTWLAGYYSPDLPDFDRELTDKLREHMIKIWLETVRKLIPIAEAQGLNDPKVCKQWSSH